MHDRRFYDLTHDLIERGEATQAMHLLFGKMYEASRFPENWSKTCAEFRAHPVYAQILEDPCTLRAFEKPRGYAGDAALIDLFYDQRAPNGTSETGREIFEIVTDHIPARALRFRRDYAADLFAREWASGKQICVLACGHLREADALIGKDLTNVTVVDQDAESLAVVAQNHNGHIHREEANVLHYLRRAAREGTQFDFIYTLGLTDYFDTKAMSMLYRMIAPCLAPNGGMMAANFTPGHMGQGWMEASMDWLLINRTEADMERHAGEIGLTSTNFRDPTGSVVFSEMTSG